MQANGRQIVPRPGAKGQKIKAIGLRHLDGRTMAVAKARRLAAEFKRNLGGELSEGQRMICDHAASLAVIAEDAQSRWLRGEPISLEQIVRAQRIARLAAKDVRLMRKRPRPMPTALDALMPHAGSDDDE
jgi:hypothetical protein